MRCKVLLPIFLFSSLFTLAQNKPDKVYAIVGHSNGNYNWVNIQEIDLSTGDVTRRVYETEKTVFELVDSKTKKKIEVAQPAPIPANQFSKPSVATVKSGVSVRTKVARSISKERMPSYNLPTAGVVAAAAYDQRHNKLFFTPMQFGELRWVDLYDHSNSLKVYCLTDQLLTPKEIQNETVQVTRMVIAADGNGYALSNDANYFIRFSTGRKPEITQLGALKDDEANNKVSVHHRSMFGGDMIADAFGDLYLVTATASIFKIDVKSLRATYLGAIQGLPQRYTTNGAAVNNEGDVIVSSANVADGYFKVDLNTLKAEKVNVSNQPNSSDLASGNFAFDKRKKDLSNASLRTLALGMTNGRVNVFHNPVTQQFFKVNFRSSDAGQYDVQLVELSGKIVFQKRITIGMQNQTEQITLDGSLARGVYTVQIVDHSKKILSTGNILLQ